MKSYTSKTVGPRAAIANFFSQIRALRRLTSNVDDSVAEFLSDYRQIEEYIGRDLSRCSVLEIGHGQLPLQTAYFTCRARRAIGIDIDVVPTGFNPLQYVSLLGQNGVKRTLKTLGREVLGFNRRYRQSFVRLMGLDRYPDLELRTGDATQHIDLPDNTMDVVFSTDVFEHLSDPVAAIQEIKRVVKPGGVVVTRTLHWGHWNAKHDIRCIVGEKPARWAHLRPSLADEVQQGAFVNQVRVSEWLQMFEAEFGNLDHRLISPKPQKLAELAVELETARDAGELPGFTDEELLTSHVLMRCEV